MIYFSSILLILSLAALPGAAQEDLLELPGVASPKKSSSTNQLELLSPDEISDLYDDSKTKQAPPVIAQPPVQAPPPPPTLVEKPLPEQLPTPSPPEPEPDLAAQEPVVTPPPPAEKDSYTTLVEDLDSGVPDQSTENFDLNSLWTHKSVMLLPKEVKIFNAALSRYLKSLLEPVVEVVEETISEEPNLPPVGRYPFVTLDSIMYLNQDNWAAWINGTRYSPTKLEELAGLTVTEVTKSQVKIHWRKPPSLGKELQKTVDLSNPLVIIPGLDRSKIDPANLESLDLEKPEPAILPEAIEKIDNKNYVISLSPNQAFITSDYSIHEGRAATARIAEIYQMLQFKKRQTEIAKTMKENSATPELTQQEAQDQESIENLLKLYKNSEETSELSQ